ncbi:hypothetical protein AYK20_03205 [Thermoplasmatales archaeon SG8-52-1]|nr:MAG: hypothetical protein AYK20_03205 [Thermoplasmatales archaeon SG8-52-1]
MKNSWYKKSLIVLIILIIKISTVSSISPKNMSTSIDNLLIDNDKTESNEVYDEIITFIYGACDEVIINKEGVIKDVEFYCWGTWGVELGIRGWVKPFKHIHEIGIFDIYASKFIGKIVPTTYDSYIIRGYAIGNIEWE